MSVQGAQKQRINVICFLSDLNDTFAKVSLFILCFLDERQARDTGARECSFFCFHNPKQSHGWRSPRSFPFLSPRV